MAELRKISEEELQEILEAHRRWVKAHGEDGQQADLSNCDLQKADFWMADLYMVNLQGANLQDADLCETNLQGANLRGANLQKANLQDADLYETDLRGADLQGADLRGANVEYAQYNLEQFANVEPHKQPKVIRFQIQLQETKQALENVRAEGNTEKTKELMEKVKRYEILIQSLENKLRNRINKAKNSLETSLKTTKERIEHNTAEAKQISRISKRIFTFTLFLLIAVPFALHGMPPSETIKQLGTFAALLYTLPVVATLLIGTTLLRHHKKLQDEIRHFSDQQQRIELYSGLLEASQHAAAAFHKENNNRAAEELVEETFKAIRDRLLSEQAAAAERSQESDEDPPLLNKLTDIVGKLTEAAAKSGKDDKN